MPVTVLGTGDSLAFRKNPHGSVPNVGCLYPGVGVSGLSGEVLVSLCTCALGIGVWGPCAQNITPTPSLATEAQLHTQGGPGYRLGLGRAGQTMLGSLDLCFPLLLGLVLLLASKPTSHSGGPSIFSWVSQGLPPSQVHPAPVLSF